jgi:hypothetical protein
MGKGYETSRSKEEESVHIQSERAVMTGVNVKTQHAFAGDEYVKDGR